MKNIIFSICCLIIYFTLPSCEGLMGDFLDKAPGVDVTQDTIFSSKVQVETFVAGTYERGIHSVLPLNHEYNKNFTMTESMTDEAEANEGWLDPQQWNQGSITDAGSFEDGRYNVRWGAIRRCNILLERIDDVPDADQDYKNQVRGEALVIRALNYFEMLKRYGGMPIVDKAFGLNDDFDVSRATIAEMVDFIVEGCDEAVGLLPVTYPSGFRGRITKTAALALKSRTLLYAASPLFNTSEPYLNFGENNSLISYGNFDNTRWQLAADAAKAAIDAAPAGNFFLVTDKGINKSYQYVWEVSDNSEIILANKFSNNSSFWAWPTNMLIPKPMNVAWGGVSATHNFIKLYEKKDGTPQTWAAEGGDDLLMKYSELDPRFAQTMAPVGSKWSNTIGIVESFVGGKHEAGGVGVWVHKRSSYDLSWSVKPIPNNIIFRVGELYLNYAEALNEAQGPVAEAYDAVNIIRRRSGMPDLPSGLTQDEFRARVRNERAIELAYEDHRFWDLRRWRIAEEEGLLNGAMWGVKVYKIDGSTEYRYEPYKFEDRIFYPKMYLHPLPRTEVLKGYLVQNPGY